jgi:hypothetical protein
VRFEKIDSTSIFHRLPYKGKFLFGYSWKDKNGVNILYITRTLEWKSGISQPITKNIWAAEIQDSIPLTVFEPSKRGSISVSHVLLKGNKVIPVWQQANAIEFCEFSLTLRLLEASIHITDTDKNGVAEFWYGVHTACSSDLSPAYYKLSMHEMSREIIRSGRALIVWGNDKWGGEISRDEFKAGSTDRQAFAQQIWEANLKQELH